MDATPSLSRTGLVLAALISALPPVAAYAPKGTVVLAAAAAATLMFDAGVRARLRALPVPNVLWTLAPLMAWALVSLLWTPDPARALRLWGAVVALVAIGRVLVAGAGALSERERKRLGAILVLGGAVLIVIMAVENISGGLVIKLLKGSRGKGVDDFGAWVNPGNAILAVFALPLAAAAAERINLAAGAAMLAGAAAVVALGTSNAAQLAVTASIIGFLATVAGRRPFLVVFALSLVAGQLAAPWVVQHVADWKTLHAFLIEGSVSRAHRLVIWEFTTARIFEHPVIGWGLDASRFIPGAHDSAFAGYGEVLPLHPHNGFLQIWLELGGVGAAAMALALAAAPFLVQRAHQSWPAAGTIMGTLSAYAVLGQLSYGIWQSWWIATGVLALALAAGGSPGQPTPRDAAPHGSGARPRLRGQHEGPAEP